MHSFIRIYVAGIALLSAVATFAAVTVGESMAPGVDAPLLGVLTFLVLGLGLEVSEHKLAVGAAGGSIAFLMYIGAGLVFGPLWCAFVGGLSVAFANILNHRPPIKTVFNVGQHVLALSTGLLIYLVLGGKLPPTSLDVEATLIPFTGLALGYFLINSTAVSSVIAISEGMRFGDVWMRNTWGLAAYNLVAHAFGLGIALFYSNVVLEGNGNPLLLAGLVVPILFLRHTYMVNLKLQSTNRELLELMVKAIEARDPYTSGHSQRVSELAREVARAMGLSYREVEQIATAALLHDVGKIYEEFAPILRKEGKLTPDERRIMESHSERSAELVSTISSLRGYVERIVRHHHENFDGSGYPDGLAANEIPLGARIVMVADTTDAMITDRPYRKALTYERVQSEVQQFKGMQFDPRVVDAFLRSPTVRRIILARQQQEESLRAEDAERRVQLVAQ